MVPEPKKTVTRYYLMSTSSSFILSLPRTKLVSSPSEQSYSSIKYRNTVPCSVKSCVLILVILECQQVHPRKTPPQDSPVTVVGRRNNGLFIDKWSKYSDLNKTNLRCTDHLHDQTGPTGLPPVSCEVFDTEISLDPTKVLSGPGLVTRSKSQKKVQEGTGGFKSIH